MSLPPGPRWPAVLQTISLLRGGQRFIERAAARYGDLFTIRTLIFGTQVMTSDPELIKQIFTGDPGLLHAGEANSSAPLITGRTSVLVLDDEPHKRARRLLMPPFHGERMHAYAEEMRAIARRVASGWGPGRPFSLLPSFQRITLEVIVSNVFGLSDGPRRANLLDELTSLTNVFMSPLGAFFLIPALQRDLGPLWPWRRLKARLDALNELLFKEIADRRASSERGDDILSMLLDAKDEDGRSMPDAEIRDQMMTLVAGGQETTASSLAWVFERLLAHDDVRDKVIRELDEAEAQGKTRAADVAALPYLDAVVKEVLRQRPSVPMLGRKLTRPMKLRDYEIPAGAMVVPSVHLTHRRPDLYPDPEAFKPERFMGKKIDPYTYFPFGGGQRRCLGAAFATQEIKVVVGTLLRGKRLRLVKPPPLKPSPRSIFLAPEGGVEVTLAG